MRIAVVTARRELDPKGLFGIPVFEAENLPDPDSSTAQPYERKRPDAQWVHDDPTAADDRHREKSFVVECKRLGFTTSAGWNLNEQYVVGGVERFRSPDHRYGVHLADGAMIGYVQSMGLPAAHAEVCQHLFIAGGLPPLMLSVDGWQQKGISELYQGFQRNFPVSPFRLTHLWLDIQDIPKTPAAPLVSPSVAKAPSRRSSVAKKASSRSTKKRTA
ncbi:hypothetical protein [Polyangium jinanense]|uniref:Uncharacterized protein n=1 Tax=Polyangium jinanense TaxID=2829994 RepID=A0A9X3XEQ2_9BACT|nr:hypothetical protein [Polyangium jinanense]MDC3989009.1 hypothetical protein [Polyangium jinanense]